MSSGLTTALEFLMSAEIAKTFLLQNLESVVPLAATFALRAMMSLLLRLGDGGRPPPGQCQGRRGWRKEITAKNSCQTFAVQGTSTL